MGMMEQLAEQRIRDAMADGAFKNLPGRGKPLRLEDEQGVTETLRMAYKVLKNADVLPPEMELRKELLALEDLIEACQEDHQRDELQRKLTVKRLQFDMVMEKRRSRLPSAYRGAVSQLFSR